MLDTHQLEDLIYPHDLTDEQHMDVTQIRDAAFSFITDIENLIPDSREKSLARTNVEQAVMWAVKAISMPNRNA
jgi:hypothetical protein